MASASINLISSPYVKGALSNGFLVIQGCLIA